MGCWYEASGGPLEICDVLAAEAAAGRCPAATGFLIGFLFDEGLKMFTGALLRMIGAAGPPVVGVTEFGPEGGCAGELLIVVEDGLEKFDAASRGCCDMRRDSFACGKDEVLYRQLLEPRVDD